MLPPVAEGLKRGVWLSISRTIEMILWRGDQRLNPLFGFEAEGSFHGIECEKLHG